jgi:phosphoribosylformylglycinamidine (FGAM) synthase PurS component
MSVTRCVEVTLTIPDNEAETARQTLQRLGVHVGKLERADLYRFELEPDAEAALVASLRGIETIYNPNKHALRVRDVALPLPGEVWIDEPHPADDARSGVLRLAGRRLPGVSAVERFTAWRVLDEHGRASQSDVVGKAVETLLCNPAFQRATHT